MSTLCTLRYLLAHCAHCAHCAHYCFSHCFLFFSGPVGSGKAATTCFLPLRGAMRPEGARLQAKLQMDSCVVNRRRCLGLDLAQVCTNNQCFHHHFVHTCYIFCNFAHNVHIEHNSCLLCTLRAHCAHLVHTVHTVHTRCRPCAHCALRMFSVTSQEPGGV
jgi:hypothetical protein